jgi:hypothetical protein
VCEERAWSAGRGSSASGNRMHAALCCATLCCLLHEVPSPHSPCAALTAGLRASACACRSVHAPHPHPTPRTHRQPGLPRGPGAGAGAAAAAVIPTTSSSISSRCVRCDAALLPAGAHATSRARQPGAKLQQQQWQRQWQHSRGSSSSRLVSAAAAATAPAEAPPELSQTAFEELAAGEGGRDL